MPDMYRARRIMMQRLLRQMVPIVDPAHGAESGVAGLVRAESQICLCYICVLTGGTLICTERRNSVSRPYIMIGQAA